jgi:hypothetical protein
MDWNAWLQDGDAIASAVVTLNLETLDIDQVDHASGIVSWRLSGGTVGQDYIVTCQVTTISGLVDERSVRYRVRDR